MNEQQQIEEFLDGQRFAVVGASQDRSKYGNKVLRVYQQNHMEAVPPPVTERVVNEAVEKGIKHIWMQPGAESDAAILAAEAAGMNVIASGPCILVALRYRGD